MIAAHLPALQVVLPLICAPVCMLVRHRDWSWSVALFASWASLAISWMLLQQVLTTGIVSYELGNWSAPFSDRVILDATAPVVGVAPEDIQVGTRVKATLRRMKLGHEGDIYYSQKFVVDGEPASA